ncbi:MAG: hypothetical protein Q9192_005370, partial [Flavoplaca navasiana]
GKVHPDVRDRISFMVHDFFEEQPVKNAEVYYFRNIFHDWPDVQCITILQNLIPALKPGAHVIIDNFGLQDPLTLPPYQERVQRYVFIPTSLAAGAPSPHDLHGGQTQIAVQLLTFL